MSHEVTDMIEQARRAVKLGDRYAYDSGAMTTDLVGKLADEVERLRAEVERLAPRAALVDDVMKEFAACEEELWRLRADSVELTRLTLSESTLRGHLTRAASEVEELCEELDGFRHPYSRPTGRAGDPS